MFLARLTRASQDVSNATLLQFLLPWFCHPEHPLILQASPLRCESHCGNLPCRCLLGFLIERKHDRPRQYLAPHPTDQSMQTSSGNYNLLPPHTRDTYAGHIPTLGQPPPQYIQHSLHLTTHTEVWLNISTLKYYLPGTHARNKKAESHQTHANFCTNSTPPGLPASCPSGGAVPGPTRR